MESRREARAIESIFGVDRRLDRIWVVVEVRQTAIRGRKGHGVIIIERKRRENRRQGCPVDTMRRFALIIRVSGDQGFFVSFYGNVF